jgi:hypothetical protein
MFKFNIERMAQQNEQVLVAVVLYFVRRKHVTELSAVSAEVRMLRAVLQSLY